jgi:hypothetical protein
MRNREGGWGEFYIDVVKLVCLERFRVIVARGAAPARVRDVCFFTDSERPQLFSEQRAVGR